MTCPFDVPLNAVPFRTAVFFLWCRGAIQESTWQGEIERYVHTVQTSIFMFFNQSEVEFPNWWDNLGARSDDDESGDVEFSETGENRFPEREENRGDSPDPFPLTDGTNGASGANGANGSSGEKVSEADLASYSVKSRSFDQEILRSVWEYGEIIPGNDSDLWRKDEGGNWIYRLDYGNRNSEFGWEVFDPGVGRQRQGIFVMRPLQWQSYLRSCDYLGS